MRHVDRPVQVRRIGPARMSVAGIYAFRGETPVPYESTLERDFIIRHEFSLAVLDIIPQPCQIPYRDEHGRRCHYTPDFLVFYRLGDVSWLNYPRPRLIEVKPVSEWRKHWRKWLPKWRAAWRYARDQGWVFHIHDETRIRDMALNNIRFLERHRRLAFPEDESLRILDTVRAMGVLPVHYLLARHFMGRFRAEGIAHLWHLLAVRRLDCDITRPLGDHTELWIPADDRRMG